MLTPKENYMRVLRGQMPEWVPSYTMMPVKGKEQECATALIEPTPVVIHHRNHGGKDIWGVNYVGCDEAGGATLPEPGNFILKDITKWRDVIKAPDFSDIDWERVAKKDIEDSGIDRRYTALAFNASMGYFQTLMAFMGFTNGLMAMFEEPDEVKALLEYLCDFYCGVTEKCIEYFKPDVYTMLDDSAAWANPFISMDMFKEFLMPCYERQVKFANDRGLPITFHNCGKCMPFMEELHKIGIVSWDPAQHCNDLDAFKAKYGNSYVICGGWDGRDEMLRDDVTEEQVRASVRRTMERYGSDGGYIWCGGLLGAVGDEKIKEKNRLLSRVVKEIGENFYKS